MIRSHFLWISLLCWLLLSVSSFAQSNNIYYVTADGKPVNPANVPGITLQKEWMDTTKVSTLEAALKNAQAGDEIWIKGYEMGAKGDAVVYQAPDGGFKLKSGVSIYGGFAGDEKNKTDRRTDGLLYRLRYRTILTGDENRNDVVDPVNYIFPGGNNNRDNNRRHVIDIDMTPTVQSGNKNTTATVVNGCIVARGHAYDAMNPQTQINGGGIYIHGNNTGGGIFRIERCFFTENYGYYGGAIYVAAEVKNVNNGANLIDRCSFFNNAAGEREKSSNYGGAVCIAGQGYVFNSTIYNNENGGVLATKTGSSIINCTITRNTGAGVDGFTLPQEDTGKADQNIPVHNSVIWGNSKLTTNVTDNMPDFQYSAYPEAGTLGADPGLNNLLLSEKNNEAAGPSFTLPSTRTGYDIEFKIREEAYPQWNWEPMEETTLVDKGNNKLYNDITFTQNPDQDLNGQTRIQGTIDIGAYEFQPLAPGRRRYVKQDGTGKGTSWEDASGDLQAMIDELATNNLNNLPGEVWVAGGEYKPNQQLINGKSYSATFRMRDGISVYGGFKGGEKRKDDRPAMDFPWEASDKQSIVYLTGSDYSDPILSNNRWDCNATSRHVVWFAPAYYAGETAPFKMTTVLDRVCIQGGKASGINTDEKEFETDKGGGVYMNDANAYLRNCVVKYSTAKTAGGGVYLKNGRIIGSLVYNCNAGIGNQRGDGGAVYVDETGMVLRSMLVNNTADRGAGVFLNNADGKRPEYLVASTNVISNNTSRINGAVYCYKGGVLTQNTITNNYCPIGKDAADKNAAQTGGVYINEFGTVINSIIWNNRINLTGETTPSATTDIPMFALAPKEDKVMFLDNAMSSRNNAVWNDIRVERTLDLGDQNTTTAQQMGPDFTVGREGDMTTDEALETRIGALNDVKWIHYYWRPRQGSNLWSVGMPIGQFPQHVLMTPELDITALNLFAPKPSVGAFMVKPQMMIPEDKGNELILYVDGASTSIHADGSSWQQAHRALHEAIQYFSNLDAQTVGNKRLVIRIKAQELWPRFAYANEDPKTATLRINPTRSGQPLILEGSWFVNADGTAQRDPQTYRTILNANHEGKKIENGNYHCINVYENAKVELDGFHIINGYAASTAAIRSGAGLLAKEGSEVVLRNCIFENNTANTAAAIDARNAKSLTMINCVVNNNTNVEGDTESVIGLPETTDATIELKHLTVVNNVGAAPSQVNKEYNSFAAGNTHTASNTFTETELATLGKEGSLNFTNPTKTVGATMGFDTYLGGYSEFRPLTRSVQAAQIINKGKGTDLDHDITLVNDRDLGGLADLGAYEADLPKKRRVYYVRTDGNDNNDGLSWEHPFAKVRKAVETAAKGEVINGEKPQVWVAAGTYQQSPQDNNSVNCFEILDGVNVFGAFPKTGTPGMGDRHPFISDAIYHDNTYKAEEYETILKPTPGVSGRVLGQAHKHNPINNSSSTITYDYIFVGEGKGDYVKSEAEYTPKEGGEYYFGTGNKDGYWKAASQYADWLYVEKTGYYKFFDRQDVTAEFNLDKLEQEEKKLIEVGEGYGLYKLGQNIFGMISWTTSGQPKEKIYTDFKESGYYEVNSSITGAVHFEASKYHSVVKGRGNYIKVEAGKYHEVGKGFGNYTREGGGYINVGMGNGSYAKVARRNGAFEYPTTWDGFTLRDGKQDSPLPTSNRNGGAGAAVFTNVTLKNCIITDCKYTTNTDQIRAAGIYCDEGKIVNCYIQKNILTNSSNSQYSTAYGAGIYLYDGTMYNCIVNANIGNAVNTDGVGIFIENGVFFNNTVVGNKSNHSLRGNGGICVYYKAGSSDIDSELLLYNCISVGNEGFGYNPSIHVLKGNADIALNGGSTKAYNCVFSEVPKDVTSENCTKSTIQNLFRDFNGKNFRLKDQSVALNMGKDAPVVDGETIFLHDFTDMDFTERIKDCRVDAGAYESQNEENFGYATSLDGNVLTYYVTQTGTGTSSGDSPDNAACAMKLQRILNHAGETVKKTPTAQVIVKVAGYPGKTFVYHANTLSDSNDPQSYTYVVPYGVTLMGGYNEGLNGEKANWNEDHRDAAQYMTVFSAIKQGTTTQDVNGYHALTFGEKPADWPEGKEKTTLVDGIYLEDGAATSLVPLGDDRTRGGGAIVPAWAHLRNCVVRNNQARQGGGLYVLPGGLVTGCGIMQNTSENEGGGIYADNDEGKVTKNNRAHLFSNTIVENTANAGGGIYLEDGAAMTVNTVVWGNQAGSDKNVSGVVNMPFEDSYFTKLQQVTGDSWYPFNNCYIEQAEFPSNFGGNPSMSSVKNQYFSEYFTLKPYSILVDKGMVETIQEELAKTYGIATYDMQGIARRNYPSQPASMDKLIDVGAYAYTGGTMRTDYIVKRLFVSPANNFLVKEGMEDQYLGRTFMTSFTWLEDAIDYINEVRKDPNVGELARQTTFEILMAQGTYKPKRMRANAAIQIYDQRLNSFQLPYNVNVYGGFQGDEMYSSDGLDSLELADGRRIDSLRPDEDIIELCRQRPRSDFNDNGVLEPWELTNQTILSGEMNVSSTEQNAYHVVYSEKALPGLDANGQPMEVPDSQTVVLDGLTIMKGITHNSLQQRGSGLAENEVGRGGGIYSKGMEYVLANCRLLENKAVRGGGIFLWDADLYLFNNLVAGNYAANGKDDQSPSFGGGILVAATHKPSQSADKNEDYRLRAINNLFANNESDNMGGAIAAGNSENSIIKFGISSMNNTFVRNKAKESPIIFNSYGEGLLINTLLWGNEGKPTGETGVKARILNCASDVDYHGLFHANDSNQNHLIDKENMSFNGPRFNKPATQAGYLAYDSKALWNPIAISLATDNGYGKMDKNGLEDSGDSEKPNYKSFWEKYIPKPLQIYKDWYNYDNGEGLVYNRYSGPVNPKTGNVEEKPIDIGCYEYQYISRFSTMDKIYVAEVSSGRGTGENWENATDDLRGAIAGASNPEQNATTHRTIYVKGGSYASLQINDEGAAYLINTSNPGINNLNLTIKGSCTGIGLGSKAVQNFSQPSYIGVHPEATKATKQLMAISVNSAKHVTIEGFSFSNPESKNERGIGIQLNHVKKGAQVTLKQTAFRGNLQGVAVGTSALQEDKGKFLAVNTLFADNETGLANQTSDQITLVNTTFANNKVADMTEAVSDTYNSVTWNNKKNNMLETEGHYNKVFTFTGNATAAHNANVLEGPNFRDPLNTDVAKRDYRIRPSKFLLNTGNNQLYMKHGDMSLNGTALPQVIPDSVKDLYNTNRQVGEHIDIGAYEYEAVLQPIIYVMSNVVGGKADGSSWTNATGDLQGAVDLAGLYTHPDKKKTAYVFVDHNVKPQEALTITLQGVKVYGGMNGESYKDEDNKEISQPTGSVTAEMIVDRMLSQRTGMLMQREHSKLTKLQLNADAVVDGFEVEQEAVVNKGTLSTSIVGSANASGSKVSGQKDGLLYNSLVYGNVNGVKAVNVTATGTIGEVTGNGNNRSTGKEVNRYVTDAHWKYQLNETSKDINGGKVEVQDLIKQIGHDRDLIGNLRIRDDVDNGCFETWNLPKGGEAKVEDYPLGKSVVYVGSEQELVLTKPYTVADPFSPGFLLLEHHAGLRGNGHAVTIGKDQFAVERLLGKAVGNDTKAYDMAVMPFDVTKMETFGNKSDASTPDVQLKKYDADKRAAYNYKSGQQLLWMDTQYDTPRDYMTTGWLIEGDPETKVRFYGKEYIESQHTAEISNPTKTLSLKKRNFSDPWNGSQSSDNKFTHKENMSWNLFGSPYLCAMKYTDMEYGRVIYAWQDGSYITAKTYDDSGQQLAHGYIPAGDAVFTQTATLKESENLTIAQPDASNALTEQDVAYAGQAELLVALARNLATRSETLDTKPDVLQLHAVDAAEARTDFDLDSDGVKWTSLTAMPQLYAVQNSGHYSLLSAVNREGTVTAGVSLPEAGMYTFSIPEDCDLTNYEVVLLHDAVTGLSTDLTEMPYDFAVTEACETETRFTLSFVRKDSGLTQAIRVRRIASHTFRIEGTQPGDLIRIFSTDGKLIATATASAATHDVKAFLPATAIVEVKRDGKAVGVVKVK